MEKEIVEKILAWLRQKDEEGILGSCVEGDTCIVSAEDLPEFCRMLTRLAGPDMIGFQVMISGGGIVFGRRNLEKAVYL